MLRDSVTIDLLDSCIVSIYNMKPDAALDRLDKISRRWPEHPADFLLKGMIIYWAEYPLIPSSPSRGEYEYNLRKCMQLCEDYNSENRTEYLLANLCARGLLLLFYSDNDLNNEVFPLATSTYWYIRRSFELTDSIPDFYFFTGLYDYYREAYPRAHPLYKPLAVLFPKGDMDRGLNELKTASAKSIVLKAEALSFLSYIYRTFENDLQRASDYSKKLYTMYPANTCFFTLYIRDLLLTKQYDEAEQLLSGFRDDAHDKYVHAQIIIFNAILQEKRYHNKAEAERLYGKGFEEITQFGAFGNEYAAYACFGLSRIYREKNDKKNQAFYRRKAVKLSLFRKLDFDD